jgi:flagellar biogenesis protein FliO
LTFIFVFGLLAIAISILRKRTGQSIRLFRPSTARSLTAVERISLTPQHSLHLVRAAGRELLLATHPHGCTVLADERAGESGTSLQRKEHA